MTSKEFLYNLETNVSSESLEGKETRFHFDLDGEGGGQYTVQIENEELSVKEGFHGEPSCTVKATSENFMKVIRGELKPLNALLFGKVKVSNQGELIKYAKVFGLMK